MKRWVYSVCFVLAAVFALAVPAVSRANDAPGCEGLAEFREAIMPIGERWAEAQAAIGIGGPDWSPATLSSDDWVAYADLSLSRNRELKEIDAPEWLADWLDVRIDSTALQEQLGKAAAEGGFLVLLAFGDEIEKLDQRDTEARQAAIERCAVFEQFAYDWDALDGEVDGTPVATSTR